MSSDQSKKTDPPAAPTSTSYKKSLAKQKKLKQMRKMKLKDRAGDIPVSDVSDVEVVGEGEEEPQDAWLNDLLKSDGDGGKVPNLPSMEVGVEQKSSKAAETPQLSPKPSQTVAAQICAFTSDNSALLGFGIATIAITLIAGLRK